MQYIVISFWLCPGRIMSKNYTKVQWLLSFNEFCDDMYKAFHDIFISFSADEIKRKSFITGEFLYHISDFSLKFLYLYFLPVDSMSWIKIRLGSNNDYDGVASWKFVDLVKPFVKTFKWILYKWLNYSQRHFVTRFVKSKVNRIASAPL